MILSLAVSLACNPAEQREAPLERDLDRPDPELVEIELPPLDDLEPELVKELQIAFGKLGREALDSDSTRAAAFGELGMLCQAHQLRPTARRCYRNAEALNPSEFRWPYLIGQCERDDGKLNEAAGAFRRALAIRPDYLPALIQLAEVDLELGRHAPAEEVFRRALELDASCASALVGLARTSSARGDHRSAADHLERAIALQPRATALHYSLALAYRALGDPDRAESQMARRGSQKVVISDPVLRDVMERNHSTRLLVDRGRAAAQSRSWTLAEGFLQAAVGRDPEQETARLLLGLVLDQLGRPSEALEHYQASLSLDPDNPRTHYGIALLYARERSDPQALGHFRRALELDPGLKQARRELARALERSGESALALTQYDTLLEDDPLNTEARLRAVLCLIRLGRHSDARARLDKDLIAFPAEAAFAHLLARLLAASPDDSVRDGVQSLMLIEELSTRLQDATFAETTAMALAETARFDEARQWQHRAIQVAERAGRADLLRRMRERLALYVAGMPCRQPWYPEDRLFFPPPEPRDRTAG